MPRSVRSSALMPLTKVPTAISRAQESATSPTTRARLMRAKPPPVTLRVPSRRSPAMASPPARIAGNRPAASAVSKATPSVIQRMLASRVKCIQCGGPSSEVRNERSVQFAAAVASGTAMATASRVINRLCASRCMVSRVRLAPSAIRTASSWRRPRVRVSSRLVALAQATSRTSTTAVNMMPSTVRVPWLTASQSSGCMATRRPRK